MLILQDMRLPIFHIPDISEPRWEPVLGRELRNPCAVRSERGVERARVPHFEGLEMHPERRGRRPQLLKLRLSGGGASGLPILEYGHTGGAGHGLLEELHPFPRKSFPYTRG
jgi:hypothetical protein